MTTPVTETPPHALDPAFARPERKAVFDGLLNNPHFVKAVDAAVRAFNETETGHPGPSPAHAARAKFLEELNKDG